MDRGGILGTQRGRPRRFFGSFIETDIGRAVYALTIFPARLLFLLFANQS